jgi:hypothetical protein
MAIAAYGAISQRKRVAPEPIVLKTIWLPLVRVGGAVGYDPCITS